MRIISITISCAPALGSRKDAAKRAELQASAHGRCRGQAAERPHRAVSRVWRASRARAVRLDRPSCGGRRVLPARINPYQHLMTRVDPKQLDALFETDRRAAPAAAAATGAAGTARIDLHRQARRPLRCCERRAVEGN